MIKTSAQSKPRLSVIGSWKQLLRPLGLAVVLQLVMAPATFAMGTYTWCVNYANIRSDALYADFKVVLAPDCEDLPSGTYFVRILRDGIYGGNVRFTLNADRSITSIIASGVSPLAELTSRNRYHSLEADGFLRTSPSSTDVVGTANGGVGGFWTCLCPFDPGNIYANLSCCNANSQKGYNTTVILTVAGKCIDLTAGDILPTL